MSLVADEVRWGRTAIPYRYGYTRRKTLAITVHPDLSVTVSAPEGTARGVIRSKVSRRGAWIANAWREFELYLPKQPPRRYISGETHRYLGRQYRLRVRAGKVRSVKLQRGYFAVTCDDPEDSVIVRHLLLSWYREHAQPVFDERLFACRKLVRLTKPEQLRLRIRRLSKRWGSCTPSGEIILNLELVKAPKECIDYVIVHELCHLSERHHSSRFWRLLDRCMRDWRERRRLLNRMADV